MNYWLFKSEPGCYGIDHLKKDKTEHWDGVRNYQARNMLRDDIKKGDMVIFYHSSCKVPAAVGVAKVVKEGYPDFTAWDPKSEHPDPKSTPDKPLWYMVDIAFVKKFESEVSLQEMRTIRELGDMQLLKRGNRLSLFPISKRHFNVITELGS
ncbi:EVE domain-containing protein [Candidatus Kaiserbacteria bacterium]|nr:MAG: EVE domain-containing protein [Candidatus Kaiserbacteria bacterium]PCI89981.1 MAG: EVE domain-containing protein [Candidatus Kaiserbacteria bacterium]